MKELNEYKAEIFRRSELMLKKRKERRRLALALGTSLCAVLLAGGMLIPAMLGSDGAILPSGNGTAADTAQEPAPVHSYIRAEIRMLGGDAAEVYTLSEPYRVTEIHYQIECAFDNGASDVSDAPGNSAAVQTQRDPTDASDSAPDLLPPSSPPTSDTEKDTDDDSAPAVEYRITLIGADGSSVSYVLTGGILRGEDGRSVTPGEDALSALFEAIAKKGE